MSWSKIRPLGANVLVRLDEREKMYRGVLHIPDDAQRQPQSAVVIAVGPGYIADRRVTDNRGYQKPNEWRKGGERIPLEVQPGDRVLVGKWNGVPIESPDHDPEGEYYMVSCDLERIVPELYAIVEDGPVSEWGNPA